MGKEDDNAVKIKRALFPFLKQTGASMEAESGGAQKDNFAAPGTKDTVYAQTQSRIGAKRRKKGNVN